jgi:hypothetical protein
MIRVTIELDSFITGKTTVLGVMCIANKGDAPSPDRGNYKVAVLKKNMTHLVKRHVMPSGDKVLRTGEVLDYPRLAYNVWRLVIRSLKSCFPEEK